VHIDCDAFYAAVEELDRPELKEVPFAVGKGVLTTCNYVARTFGCRSGMAGFVAKKLCPQLISLPLNFGKYTAKAEEVRQVLAKYDSNFESASIDEAYLNITAYCEEYNMDPVDVVAQLRSEVQDNTKVTVSAGIAANAKLAKICSNKNKPNGQFHLPNDRSVIMAFMKDLPTRKVNGIGRVLERELDAIGVKTCGDIYDQRAYLSKLFGEKAFQFLLQCYLGLGRTKIRPPEESERKSVGTESTFRDTSGSEALREKLRHQAEELEKDLERTQYKGRTLCLKIKLHTYEVFTRQTVLPKAINSAEDLYRFSEPMLSKLEKEFPEMKLRLMGLRMTNLVSTKKGGIDFFGVKNIAASANAFPESERKVDKDGWEIWPETEFEEAARQERQDEMNETESLSQAHENDWNTIVNEPSLSGTIALDTNHNVRYAPVQTTLYQSEYWPCPVCSKPQLANEKALNDHIDFCLSKSTIVEVARDSPAPSTTYPNQSSESSSKHHTQKKRGRSKSNTTVGVESAHKKRQFFFRS
jgi:DNA polymerase kappa